MEQVKITITIKSPTLIANTSTAGVLTSTRGAIDGRVLRGIFASQFIKSHNLGKEAHKNQEFMELFYGDIRFVSAYKDTPKGTSIPVPLSLQKNKNADDFDPDVVVDSYFAKQEYKTEKEQNLLGFKGMKGFVTFDGNNCYPVEVETAIKLHMSRSSKMERIKGRSIDGKIFNYEYLEPNQVFVGSIVASKSILEDFVRQFPKRIECQIGRSRKTEYGQCILEIGDIESIDFNASPMKTANGDAIYLRLQTPLLIGNQSIKSIIESAVKVEIDEDVYVNSVCASYQEEQTFNSIWGLRSSSESAASAGSTIELIKKTGWSDKDISHLRELLYSGIGHRVQEGYGQIRIWNPAKFKLEKINKVSITEINELHVDSQALVRNILEKQIIAEARLRAANDVEKELHIYGQNRHFATILLDEMGSNRKSGYSKLKDSINRIIDEEKIIYKTLRNIYIKQQYISENKGFMNFMEYIESFDEAILLNKCIEPLSHVSNDSSFISTLIKASRIDKKELSLKIAYEYWIYFFRHVRKLNR